MFFLLVLVLVGIGCDGDTLGTLVLGAVVLRGSVIAARPVAVLDLLNEGENYAKIIAVPLSGHFSQAESLDDLRDRYPRVTVLIETWFTHYDDPGVTGSKGFEGKKVALELIQHAFK